MIEKKGKVCYRCMEIHEADSSKCPVCGFDITNPHIYPCKEKKNTLPAGYILSNRYLIGCAILDDYFEIIYTGLDLYMEQKVFVHEFFPAGIITRETSTEFVSAISQEDKKIFQKGKELHQARFQHIKAKIPYSEHPLAFHEDNGTSYMIGKAYSFISLEDMLHRKPFAEYQEEYYAVLHALKDNLEALDAEGEQHYDIVPSRIMVGEGQVVILAGGKEKYQFAENFSSKLVMPDRKCCPPEILPKNISKIDNVYFFSTLCYSIIMSATMAEIRTYNKGKKFFHKKKLVNVIKKYNISPILIEPITAGICGRSKDYSGYAVLDEYTAFPTESFYLQPNIQNHWKNKKDRKIPILKIVTGGLAGIILFLSIFYFLIGNKGSIKSIEKDIDNCTPPPTVTVKPIPSSLPTVSPAPIPTVVPTPKPTVSSVPIPTINPTPKPTKQPKAVSKPTPKPTKKPIHTKRPTPRPTPRVTKKPTQPPERPKVPPRTTVKETKKPQPTLKEREEQISGIN